MADKDQKIFPLSTADERRLEDQRHVVSKYLSPADIGGKLATAAHSFTAKQTYELQSMEVVFGDVFVCASMATCFTSFLGAASPQTRNSLTSQKGHSGSGVPRSNYVFKPTAGSVLVQPYALGGDLTRR
jgi:hypothetical protein